MLSTLRTTYHPVPLAIVVALGLAGIYWFTGPLRKAEPPPATTASQTGTDLRSLATGPLAAFVVKPERASLPDIAFTDKDGKPLKLSDWKGRVVLLNLWATWCAPCRKEMPDLARLQQALGSKDFEVVAVSVDRKGVDASSAFLKETGADGLNLYADPSTKVLSDLQMMGLPATILVDRSGREAGRMLGPAQWASPEAQTLIKTAVAEKG